MSPASAHRDNGFEQMPSLVGKSGSSGGAEPVECTYHCKRGLSHQLTPSETRLAHSGEQEARNCSPPPLSTKEGCDLAEDLETPGHPKSHWCGSVSKAEEAKSAMAAAKDTAVQGKLSLHPRAASSFHCVPLSPQPLGQCHPCSKVLPVGRTDPHTGSLQEHPHRGDCAPPAF